MREPRLVITSLASLLLAAACDRSAPAPSPPAQMSGPTADARPADALVWRQPWPAPSDVSMPPPDAERDPATGIAHKILTPGTGTEHPNPESYVDLRYAGFERNGHQFEGSSPVRPPQRYELKELSEGMRLELQKMVVGERRRIWVPAAHAYANRPDFSNAPRGDMTFEIELATITAPPPVPEDVAAAPKNAKTTKSGLAYVVLKKGTGKIHPTENTRADVVFSAWKPDGKLFQTSILNGGTIPVRVKMLPPGWREAMLKMVEGDRWRLWLPGKLAFGELHPGQEVMPFGPPPGPVVFEVELVKILEDKPPAKKTEPE